IINKNQHDFLSSINLNDFCDKYNISSTCLQRIAKKLGFHSGSEMKSHYTSKIFESKKIESENSIGLKKYIKNMEIFLNNIDEKIINKLAYKIIKSEILYVYNQDSAFEFSTLNIFSNLFKFKTHRIENECRFKMLKSETIENKSILIFTKIFGNLNKVEKEIINFFKNKGVEIFAITGSYINDKYVNNLVIGGLFNNSSDHNLRLIEFINLNEFLLSYVTSLIYEYYKKTKN
ncbi:MAG: hypothetical protein K2H56_04110, partial [Malacoplasma sp.]|nr:hypothetical protein [Malacoplasma sp.]